MWLLGVFIFGILTANWMLCSYRHSKQEPIQSCLFGLLLPCGPDADSQMAPRRGKCCALDSLKSFTVMSLLIFVLLIVIFLRWLIPVVYFLSLQTPPLWLCLPVFHIFLKDLRCRSKQSSQASHLSRVCKSCIAADLFPTSPALQPEQKAGGCPKTHEDANKWSWNWYCQRMGAARRCTLSIVPDILWACSPSSAAFFSPRGHWLSGTEESCVVREVPYFPNHGYGYLPKT